MRDKAVVKKVFNRQDTRPVATLLKFQNGKLKTHKENVKYCRMLNKKNETRNAMVVAHDQIYRGIIDDGGADQWSDLYLCVRNKETNKVRIIPIEQACLNNQIFYKKREIKPNQELSDEQRKLKLLKEFGGRRAKRYVDNQAKNKMDVTLIKDVLNEITEYASVTEENLNGTIISNHYSQIRPKYNEEATQVCDVYDIYDVVPQTLIDRLDEEAQTILVTDLDNIPINSEYLKSSLKDILASNSSAKVLRIKLIIYMDALLNLIKTRARQLKNVELSLITEKVENDIRERFSDPKLKPYQRTAFSAEKALCYFIVLSLMLNEKYEINIETVCRELSATRAKIIKYAHVVNARLIPKTNILSLSLPSKTKPLAKSLVKSTRIYKKKQNAI